MVPKQFSRKVQGKSTLPERLKFINGIEYIWCFKKYWTSSCLINILDFSFRRYCCLLSMLIVVFFSYNEKNHWRNLTITLEVPENQASPGLFFPYLWFFFFLCGLWLSHHLSFLFPSDLKGMQNNTDPRNRFGLNLILSNGEFKQLKRVTESICSKTMGISEKNSVRMQGEKTAVLPSSPSPFHCCCCPCLSHLPPFWKLLSILLLFFASLLLQLALSLTGCCSFPMLACTAASSTRPV